MLVEAADTFERCELDVVETTPRSALANDLCHEQREDGFRQRVVVQGPRLLMERAVPLRRDVR
jgi:hypothetical protein